MAKKHGGPIPFEALCEGYRLTILNAFDLLMASMTLIDQHPIGLAVAELGQEELGKSLSILAAAALPQQSDAWHRFWSGWRDHKLKAHRAFLYELISPVRLESVPSEGTKLAGASMRASLPIEKEVGFYVAYDSTRERFVSPADDVGPVEAYHRALTLFYLGLTGRAVAQTLESRSDLLWYRLFAPLAFRICSEELDPVNMPEVFTEFGSQSSDHAELRASLDRFLMAAHSQLQEVVEGGQRLARDRAHTADKPGV